MKRYGVTINQMGTLLCESDTGSLVKWEDCYHEMHRLTEQRQAAYDELGIERSERQRTQSERDTLREAMRENAHIIRELRGVHDHTMAMLLSTLTPEQRSACGWPDAPKTMTWEEAREAMKHGKTVRNRDWRSGWSGIKCPNGRILCSATGVGWTPNLDDFTSDNWEIVP